MSPSKNDKAPSYQRYPDKWLAGTRRLSWDVKGMYADLLDIIWLHHQETCSIPDDDEYIASELGASGQEWQAARSEIMCAHAPLLVQTETGRLLSRGLLKEREKQLERRRICREAGKKGGRPRKPEKQTVSETKAKRKPNESTPTPTPTPTPAVHSHPGNPVLSDFAEVWNLYPVKSGKRRALNAYQRARKDGTLHADVLAGLERYRAYVTQQRKTFPDLKWKDGATWFHQRGWEDEYTQEEPDKSEVQGTVEYWKKRGY